MMSLGRTFLPFAVFVKKKEFINILGLHFVGATW